jgi:hypothetical protein
MTSGVGLVCVGFGGCQDELAVRRIVLTLCSMTMEENFQRFTLPYKVENIYFYLQTLYLFRIIALM